MEGSFNKFAVYMFYDDYGKKRYISGVEIVEESFDSFRKFMIEAGTPEEDITESECIKHFCIAYWAVKY